MSWLPFRFPDRLPRQERDTVHQTRSADTVHTSSPKCFNVQHLLDLRMTITYKRTGGIIVMSIVFYCRLLELLLWQKAEEV